MSPCAVVFAYHDVGVRCLRVLHAAGVEIPLVVTHRDDPAEKIWFESVAAECAILGIDSIAPENPNAGEIVARVAALQPDFLFSFYYRRMLAIELLAVPIRGAYNMHGSLLPKYRGRAPVNWAVLHGETETGATLHEMVQKPDAGRIVDQLAVQIGPEDLAVDVFRKVTVAAGTVLARSLPRLMDDGSANLRPQDLAQGSYFGGRTPEDGRIDWNRSAAQVHNLVRAVAPPFPGAFTDLGSNRVFIHRTRRIKPREHAVRQPALIMDDRVPHAIAICGDGNSLELLETVVEGRVTDARGLAARLGSRNLLLPARQ